MAAAINTFIGTLVTAFAATTPPSDGSSLAYRRIDSFTEERGNGQHREFVVGRASVPKLISRSTRLNEHTLEVVLFLHRRDRTMADFNEDIADEVNALHAAFWAQASIGWGSGVLEALLEAGEIEASSDGPKPRAGGVDRGVVVRVPFKFRVTVREED